MKEFKDKQYYLKVLENRKEALNQVIFNIDKTNKLDDCEAQSKQKARNRLSVAVLNYDIMHVMYSCEFSRPELIEQFNVTLDNFVNYWDRRIVKIHLGRKQVETDKIHLEYYIRLRWLFSLAILLDTSDEKFIKLTDLIRNDNVKDALIDFIIASKIDNWTIHDSLSIEKPTNRIIDVIFEENSEVSEKLIKTYLNKFWYKTYKNYSFYDTHLNADIHNEFKGYWAFEVAAIVKIKGLDDSLFRDNKYYPDRLLN